MQGRASLPMSRRDDLHFFPGAHLMVGVVDGQPAVRAEAWGGEEPVRGRVYKTMKPRKTTPGRYVIHSYKPYVTRTWELSRIAWGTPLEVRRGELWYATGNKLDPWRRVLDKVEDGTLETISGLYLGLYGNSPRFDPDGDGIPNQWVFNDFGPYAVRYFRDHNHNHKRDQGEGLLGEMIHTTPTNEAEMLLEKPVHLVPSHGCIHVSPKSRDKLRAAGAFEPGTDLVIHRYGDSIPASF